jgi:hypothetical protein
MLEKEKTEVPQSMDSLSFLSNIIKPNSQKPEKNKGKMIKELSS